MKKFAIFGLSVATLLGIALFQNMTTVIATAPPNILFILLDDSGQGDWINKTLMPRVDELRQQSTLFPYFYVTPMCTPTRMSLLSGRYPIDYSIFWVCGSNAIYGIPNSDETVPQSLARRGYTTAHFGKWHAGVDLVGEDTSTLPGVFQEFAIKNKFENYVTGPSVTAGGYFNPIMFRNGVEIKATDGSNPYKGKHLEDVASDLTKAYILELSRATTKKPFYVQYWLNASHGPHQPAPRMITDAAFKLQYEKCVLNSVAPGEAQECAQWRTANKRKLYELLLTQADQNLAKILDLFKTDDPYLKNTVIIISSDNGGTHDTRLGPYGNVDYLGRDLRAYKTDVFEGGIRQNLLVKMPGQTTSQVDTSLLSSLDFFPTLIELAKGTPTAKEKTQFDGQSFYPRLTSPKGPFERLKPLFWSFKVRNEDDGKTAYYDANGVLIEELDQMSFAVRKGPWKLVYEPLIDEGCRPCLFEIKDGYTRESNGRDGSVSNDVASSNPQVVAELRENYIEWLLLSTQLPVRPVSQGDRVVAQSEVLKGFTQETSETIYNFELANRNGLDWVSLQNNYRFDVNRLDFTFSAQITPKAFLGKPQVIAMREGTWVFQINAERRLQLLTYSRSGEVSTNTVSEQLSLNQTYDVAFVIYAFKDANSVIRIYARDYGQDLDNVERLTRLLRAEVSPGLKSNNSTIYLGAKPNKGWASFVGTIAGARLYHAPLRKIEIGYGMRWWGNTFD